MFLSGVLVNILNLKLTVLFALLPQLVGTDVSRPWMTMVEISAVFMAVKLVVFAGYGVFATSLRDPAVSRPAVMT